MKHDDYYNHFDANNNYEKTIFLASGTRERSLQSAELNELEDRVIYNRRELANVLLKNGDLLDGRPTIKDGKISCPNCKVYADGSVRTVENAIFPYEEGKVIGIKRHEELITYDIDQNLGDPVKDSENSGLEGAARLKVTFSFADTDYDYAVFIISEGRVICRSVKKLSYINQTLPQIIVSKTGDCSTLEEALALASPGDRILVKEDQFITKPLEIKVDDLSIEIESGVSIQADKNMGFKESGEAEDESWKLSIFHFKAKRTRVRGGFVFIENHVGVNSQYLASIVGSASASISDLFFENISASINNGNILDSSLKVVYSE